MDAELLSIFPDLKNDTEKWDACLSICSALGANSISDMQYLKVEDLKPAFTVVQARTLLAVAEGRTSKRRRRSSDTSTSSDSFSRVSGMDGSQSTNPVWSSYSDSTSSPVRPLAVSWMNDFHIPWEQCSPSFLNALEDGRRPDPKQRKELVHMTVDAVMKVTSKPGRKNFEKLAYSIVSKYPASFQDSMDGISFGNGHGSLSNELFYRWENTTRKNRKLAKVLGDDDAQLSTLRAQPQMKAKAPYGCVDWNPVQENAEEECNMKSWLLEEYKKTSPDMDHAISLMKKTYSAQRTQINENEAVKKVLESWPFLRYPKCLLQHYGTLLNKDDVKDLPSDMARRSVQVYRVLKSSKKQTVVSTIDKIRRECVLHKFSLPKSTEIISLLAAHFDEDQFCVVKVIKNECLIESEINDSLLCTPVLVAVGSSLATSEKFKLVVERQVLLDCDDFFLGLTCMFCLYYIFNMEYPPKAVATLEFIQRYFACINVKGSKCTTSRHHKDAHPKVLSLIKKMCSAKALLKE